MLLDTGEAKKKVTPSVYSANYTSLLLEWPLWYSWTPSTATPCILRCVSLQTPLGDEDGGRGRALGVQEGLQVGAPNLCLAPAGATAAGWSQAGEVTGEICTHGSLKPQQAPAPAQPAPSSAPGSKSSSVQPGANTGGTAHHGQHLSDLRGLWGEDLLKAKSRPSVSMGTMLNVELDSRRLQRATANAAALCC